MKAVGAGALLSSLALLLLPGTGAAAPVGGTNVFTLVNAPSPCTLGAQRCFVVTYRNTLDTTVTGIVFLVVHNGIGQTLTYSTATLNLRAGAIGPAYPILFGLPPGQYNATVFAIALSGVAISTAVSVSFSL